MGNTLSASTSIKNIWNNMTPEDRKNYVTHIAKWDLSRAQFDELPKSFQTFLKTWIKGKWP